jgi:helix-turn-helix protein
MIKTEKQLKKTHEEIEQNLQQMRQFLETEHNRILETSDYTTVRVPIMTSGGINRNSDMFDYLGMDKVEYEKIYDKLVEENKSKEEVKQKKNVKFDFIANENNI